MSPELLSTLSTVAFVIAGVCLALAVFFWFFFKIPTVIGDLSGKNARKSIAKARANNEKNGNKSYKPSPINQERGKVTELIPDTKAENKKKKAAEKSKAIAKQNTVEKQGPAIDNVSHIAETGILFSNKTEGALESQETGLLNEAEETTLLAETSNAPVPQRPGGKALKMLDEIMYIHTDEVIQWA